MAHSNCGDKSSGFVSVLESFSIPEGEMMKALMILSVFLMGTVALACPNLAGNYNCPDDSGEMETVSVVQQQASGVTTYIIDGESYIADGQTRTYEENDGVLLTTGDRTVSCEGSSLRLYENSQIYVAEGGHLIGELSFVVMAQKAGSTLTSTVVGTSVVNGEKENINETSVCQALR